MGTKIGGGEIPVAGRSTTKITKRLVDHLKPGQEIWDSEVRGFGVRRQTKSRSYALKCFVNGRQKRVTIGIHGSPWTVETARKKAQVFLVAVRDGIDPIDARRAFGNQPIMAQLCSRFMDEYAVHHKKASSAHLDRKNIENHVIPLLGNRLIVDVTRADIEAFREAVRKGKTAPSDPRAQQLAQRGGSPVRGGNGVANRCLALLSKMFNLAEEWELRVANTNPVRGVRHDPERKRERFLTADEFARLGKALREADKTESPHMIAAIRLLIYTGARLGEILGLQWDWVDLDRGLLLLPDSKTGQKTIRLSAPAVQIFRSLPRFAGNPFVIVGSKAHRPLNKLQKPWRRIRDQAGLNDVRIHDLRHSFASIGVGQGLSLQVVGALLGHARTNTTERYAHLQKDHVWQANQDVGEAIEMMLHGLPTPSAAGPSPKGAPRRGR
jgi:integrase